MLKNKNVVITGSNRGIGYAILKLFAQNRANIWACTRSENSVFKDELQKLSKENKVKIKNINFDLNDISQVNILHSCVYYIDFSNNNNKPK